MSNPVELLLANSAQLARRDNLPATQARRQEHFNADGITKVELGSALALVAVVPMPGIDFINLFAYDGDEEILSTLHGHVRDSTLKVTADVPFKPAQSQHHRGNSVNGTIFGTYISADTVYGDINIGSFGGNSFTSMSGGGGTTIIIDGREVDLERPIRFALMVPDTMNLKVSGLIGAVGITDYLNAKLTFVPSHEVELMADSLKSVTAKLSGSGRLKLRRVDETAKITISGSGHFTTDSVGGKVDATVSGSGTIVVNGGTSSGLEVNVSGSGTVHHNGKVDGPVEIGVSGVANVNVRSTTDDDPEVTIRGVATVMINGRVHGKGR